MAMAVKLFGPILPGIGRKKFSPEEKKLQLLDKYFNFFQKAGNVLYNSKEFPGQNLRENENQGRQGKLLKMFLS